MADTTTLVSAADSRSEADTLRPGIALVWHSRARRGFEPLSLGSYAITVGRDEAIFAGGPLLDPRISRRHAEVSAAPEGVRLRDLGSSNGTFANGRRVQATTLVYGDVVRLGDCFFVVVRTGLGLADGDAERSLLVGESASLARVRRELSTIAKQESTVLLTGETGTGKDIAAREIHRLSGRAGRFVAVNCGALPETLMESELFGHVRGAFSGAQQNKDGLFTAADGGTLFLDEIGELPPALQAKLLRVLQSKEIRPLGATVDRQVNARVVAATNRDLIAAVNRGAFRADLYSRVSQWVVRMPPLRERREDIVELVRHLSGDAALQMTPTLVERLLLHSWPFNVRELASIVAIARVEAAGATYDLTPRIVDQLNENAKIVVPKEAGRSHVDVEEGEASPAPDLAELTELLRRFAGNVNQVAKHLGKHRYQIYRWLKQHAIDPDEFRGPPSG
ncbi:MAG: sigma 54-interacting transcriptional regulator [Myxococcales bacterium]|nr:sigma 54-interacting transcriptional regulator [Myxococcales bacterium]